VVEELEHDKWKDSDHLYVRIKEIFFSLCYFRKPPRTIATGRKRLKLIQKATRNWGSNSSMHLVTKFISCLYIIH